MLSHIGLWNIVIWQLPLLQLLNLLAGLATYVWGLHLTLNATFEKYFVDYSGNKTLISFTTKFYLTTKRWFTKHIKLLIYNINYKLV